MKYEYTVLFWILLFIKYHFIWAVSLSMLTQSFYIIHFILNVILMTLVNDLVKFTYTDSELILRCGIYNTFLMLLILIIFIIISMFFFYFGFKDSIIFYNINILVYLSYILYWHLLLSQNQAFILQFYVQFSLISEIYCVLWSKIYICLCI